MSDHSKTEFDDLNRELSGAGGAKTARFLEEGSTPRSRQEKEARKKAAQRALSRLLELLQDPEYAAAHKAANDAIHHAQTALDIALAENAQLIADLEDRAPKLSDGRAIFIRADGRGETADGEIIPLSIMVTLDIPDNAPTIEDYNAARERRRELGGYADDIDKVRDEVNDPDNPASQPRLKDITKDMSDITRRIEGVPDMKKGFDRAAMPTTEEQRNQLALSLPVIGE